jgi:hypothetical protein
MISIKSRDNYRYPPELKLFEHGPFRAAREPRKQQRIAGNDVQGNRTGNKEHGGRPSVHHDPSSYMLVWDVPAGVSQAGLTA